MALETGTLLNNIYRVVKLIGGGSMGDVYLVERSQDNKKLVAKELKFTPEAGIDPDTAREIFFREAEFMAKFNHPGLPATYGIFNHNGRDYLTMDYIEGKTLEEIINSSPGPIDEEKAIEWTLELCDILDYLHNSFHTPIVYRDLKPSNIIITPEDKVKLIDFGIARYYNPDKNTDTFSYGSPGYAAPEQYRGRGQSSPRSDVFGLGVILYQMLTKYDPTLKPFTFPSMSSLNPSISGEIENIIKRAIQLEPLKRYISIMEFKEVLEKYTGIYYSSSAGGPSATAGPKNSPNVNISHGLLIFLGVTLLFLSIFSDCARGITIMSAIVLLIYGIICGISFIMINISNLIFHTKNKFTYPPFVGIITIIAVILVLAAILVPGFLAARRQGQLAGCESNLKIIATALETYAGDNHGLYPTDLNKLLISGRKEHYLKEIPLCPVGRSTWNALSGNEDKKLLYNYIVSSKNDNFTLWCNTRNAHQHYEDMEGFWPQYAPSVGLMLRPNQ